MRYFNKRILDQITSNIFADDGENDGGVMMKRALLKMQHVNSKILHANNDSNHHHHKTNTKQNAINHLQESKKDTFDQCLRECEQTHT